MSSRNVAGPQVKYFRELLGLTQVELSEVLKERFGWHLSRAAISRIETRVAIASDMDLIYLAAALGVTVEQLCQPQSAAKEPNQDLIDIWSRLALVAA